MLFLKQSTSVDVAVGPFLDETDGKTAETGLSITQPDVRLKKNNGNWAQKNAAQTLTHEEAGWYELTLDTTDTNTLGHLVVAIHEAGALPVWIPFMVLSANVYDSLIGGGDTLDVQVTGMGANVVTAAAIDTDAINADALAADAVTEIQSGLATAAALDTVDNFLDTEIAALQADTDNIQTRLPAALVGGRMDASVGAMGANVVTAAAIDTDAINADALAADAVTEIWAKAMQDLSAVPGVTASVLDAINWLFELARNKRTQTTGTETVFKDDGTTTLATSAKSDASGTFTRSEYT